MGGVGIAGQSVFTRVQSADQIEAQQREVRQIVGGELLAGQMGVDQAEPPESAGGGAEAVQSRDEDVVMGAHDNIGDLPPAGDEEADLAVDLPGKLRQRPGQFVGDDSLRRAAPPVELPDPLDFRRSEAGQVAVYLFYGGSLLVLLLELLRADPLFHTVEEGRPRIRPERGDPFFRLLIAAFRAGRPGLAAFHDPLEQMTAGRAFIFVDRHGFP